MDANGARMLRQRIERHQQWLAATAVREGRQPPTDPNADDLVAIEHGLRRYEGGFEKRLVDGEWRAFDSRPAA